jgi:hypothetical protein
VLLTFYSPKYLTTRTLAAEPEAEPSKTRTLAAEPEAEPSKKMRNGLAQLDKTSPAQLMRMSAAGSSICGGPTHSAPLA